MRISGFTKVVAIAALASASPLLAHAKLVQSSPAANAKLAASPTVITLTFNARVVPAFSSFELTMPAHGMKVPVTTTVSDDGKRIVGTVKSKLMKGSYKVVWTAAAADGHKMAGELSFTVA